MNDATPPTITLAGEQWSVPVLAPKQNRIVVPALLEIIPKIVSAREENDGGLAQLARYLDTATYDRLMDVAYYALSRAHPELSRSDFDDLPIDTAELIGALGVIACQAGLLK